MARARILLALVALLVFVDLPARGQPRAATPTPFLVIVHPRNPVRSVTRTFLADAFLKRTTRWPHGENIRPVDQRQDAAVRARFSDSVLRRPIAAVRSYWQQVIFSGRGVPPVELDTDREVVRYVATHVGAVGYVSGTADVSSVVTVTVQ